MNHIAKLSLDLVRTQKCESLNRVHMILKHSYPERYQNQEIIPSPSYSYETLDSQGEFKIYLENSPVERKLNDFYIYSMCKNDEYLISKFECEPHKYLVHPIMKTKHPRIVTKITELIERDLDDFKYDILPIYVKILCQQEATGVLNICYRILKIMSFGHLYVLFAYQYGSDPNGVESIFSFFIQKKNLDWKSLLGYFRGLDMIFDRFTQPKVISDALNGIQPKNLSYSVLFHQIVFKFFHKRKESLIADLSPRLKLYFLASKGILDVEVIKEDQELAIVNMIPLANLSLKFPEELKWIINPMLTIMSDLNTVQNVEVMKLFPLFINALHGILKKENQLPLGQILENILELKRRFLKDKTLSWRTIANYYIQLLLHLFEKDKIGVLYVLSFSSYFSASITVKLLPTDPMIPLAHLGCSWPERIYFYLSQMRGPYFYEEFYPFIIQNIGHKNKVISLKACQVFTLHKNDEFLPYFVERAKTTPHLYEYVISHFGVLVRGSAISISLIEQFLLTEFARKKWRSRPLWNAIISCVQTLQIGLLTHYFSVILTDCLTQSANKDPFKQFLYESISSSTDYTRKGLLVQNYIEYIQDL